jgi:hypothetical protein
MSLCAARISHEQSHTCEAQHGTQLAVYTPQGSARVLQQLLSLLLRRPACGSAVLLQDSRQHAVMHRCSVALRHGLREAVVRKCPKHTCV